MSDFERLKQVIEQEATLNKSTDYDSLPDGLVPTWSFSTLKAFEECPYRVRLSKVDKVVETQNIAAVRGNAVHAAAEAFVRGEVNGTESELRHFANDLQQLKERFAKGEVELEQEWGFTKQWEPCAWSDPALWGKMKLDVFVRDAPDSAIIIDYKTGRKKGNELKHTDQGLVYTVGAQMRFPELEYVQVEFWYTDIGERLVKSYTKEQILHVIPTLERRAYRLTTCRDFEPRPSPYTCRWCSHRATDSCDYAQGA